MSLDPTWPRLIRRAIDKHVSALISPVVLYIEGQPRKTNQVDAWVELRMDGPYCKETSHAYWLVQIDVNVLCCCNVDKDIYHIDELVGKVASILNDSNIPVIDDAALTLGCLTVDTTRKGGDGIKINHFGIIGTALPKLMQATVECKYWINLEG